ncbi:MAG: GntR family transcriptional regulator, partial [Gammaproteobacteria bacterium]|nr:GntR family transcriptional regulator [Gammaproteobacteria bacterium]
MLPEDSSLGLRDQICEMVSSAITNQALSPEKRLPSCREMAEQLGVSRNTVFSAYNRLMDLGLLIAKNRSGYFVNPIAHEQDLHGHRADLSDIPAPVKFKPLGLVPVDNPLNWKSYTYPFIYNQIDPDLFPVDSWRECTRLAL